MSLFVQTCYRCHCSAGTTWMDSNGRSHTRVFVTDLHQEGGPFSGEQEPAIPSGASLCNECIYKESIEASKRNLQKGLDEPDPSGMMVDRLAEMFRSAVPDMKVKGSTREEGDNMVMDLSLSWPKGKK